MNFELIDLTHTITSDIPHWGSKCGFSNHIKLDYSECNEKVKFRIQSFEMAAGIGTHMDAPSHCIEGAASIHEIPLKSLLVPCCKIDVSNKADENYIFSEDDLNAYEGEYGEIPQNAFVMIYTGWDQWWDTPAIYRNKLQFPSVSVQAAEVLVERNIAGLGIDTLSPDAKKSGFPVHQILLGAGKYIIENVANARQLNPVGDYVATLPMKIENAVEAPVRMFALRNVERGSGSAASI